MPDQLKFAGYVVLMVVLLPVVPLVWVVYSIFEFMYLLIKLVSCNNLKRSEFKRDSSGAIYRDYEFFSYDLKIKKPFIFMTFYAPNYFQMKSIFY